MRLVLIGPVYPYRGGIAHYTTMLYRALQEREHQVLLISFKRQYPQRFFPGSSDKDPSRQPLRVEESKYWIDSLNPFTWLATFWRIRRYSPDMVILQWWTTFWAPVWFVLGWMQRLFLRRQLLVLCHNVLPHEPRRWDPLLARMALSLGTRFIVQSREERDRLLGLVPDAKVTVVPHPVYDMFAGDRVPREEARRRLGLPLDQPVMLFFGMVREYKGLEDILAALPKLQASLERLTLVVAGEFWDDKRPYLELIDRLGVGEWVIIEDRYIPNEEVSFYFSAADVLIAPYRKITGSGVVQMARGFGLPVITTAVGGMAEVRANGGMGVLVPPGDVEALGQAILHFFLKGPTGAANRNIETDHPTVAWHLLISAVETNA
jgi:glycosyltransferase involved in cell wall biosynthesis